MNVRTLSVNGRAVVLGEKLGTGGEGSVFKVADTKHLVAKVYHKPINQEKSQKILAMSRLASDALTSIAAWPTAAILDSTNGAVCGVLMPFVSAGTEIHELYNPAHRKQAFPNFDWRHLVRTARNCAAAFTTLHEAGIVVGDVNQGNLFVSKDATVQLIDCDSFQFTAAGRVFKCEVGVPHYTPPELQSVKLGQVVRTTNHDSFGLAVMIFHLLFIGRHPFMGRYTGHGEMPTVEKAIQQHRFAFGTNCARYEMQPPPLSLMRTDVPSPIFDLFEKAFSSHAASGMSRPSAKDWASALKALEDNMTKCSIDPGHFYYSRASACPWCRIQMEGGPNLFVSVSVRVVLANRSTFDLDACWRHIEAVKNPGDSFVAARRVPATSITPRPLDGEDSQDQVLKGLFGVLGIVLFALSTFTLLLSVALAAALLSGALVMGMVWFVFILQDPTNAEKRKRKATLAEVRSRLSRARSELSDITLRHKAAFEAEKLRLAQTKASYAATIHQERVEKTSLEATARERQLEEFLAQFFIDKAKISGIGPSRTRTLEYYGIETAADVSYSAVERIPGFGQDLTTRLILWRNAIESRFKFDPQKGVPQSALAALVTKWSKHRTQLESILLQGPNSLRRIHTTFEGQVAAKDRILAKLEQEMRQAEADMQPFKRR